MHPTWCMAERVGVEPTIPLLAGYTISNRAPSASRASLRDPALSGILLTNIPLTSNFLYFKLQVKGFRSSVQRRDTFNDRPLTVSLLALSYTLEVLSKICFANFLAS